METITKIFNVYTFEELSKEAKERAINDFREEPNLDFLPDKMHDKLEQLLEQHKIEGKGKVFYSLSYSQGDGAMFEGNFEWRGNSITIKQSGHYYHYNSKEITFDDFECEEKEEKEELIANEFNELYVEICEELAQWGYDIIEFEDSEESIADLCKINDYTFLDDGEMFNN